MKSQTSPPRDRYSASAAGRPRRLPWVVALAGLAAAGLGLLLWSSVPEMLDVATSLPGEVTLEDGTKGRFLSVRGGVEYRRGDHGAWREARSGNRLAWGDWLKTSESGTAEIRLPDGTTYVLPPATLGQLVRSARFRRDDRLPGETERRDGEAAAGIDFHWVEAEKIAALPTTGPRLVDPASDLHIDLATQRQLLLAWESVPAASHYALNVSDSRSFASNIIEDTGRVKTSARIGIRGQGMFYWRVAAVGRDGARGAWSEVRSFRVKG